MNTDLIRRTDLDGAKGIGIALVVLGHILNRVIPSDHFMSIWINSFHLPMFFVVSGYLFGLKRIHMLLLRQYLKKRIETLLYPYLTFSLFYAVIYLVIIGIRMNGIPIYETATLTVRIVSGWGIGTLWFLPTLFVAEFILWVLMRFQKPWVRVALWILITALGGCMGYWVNFLWSEDAGGFCLLLYRFICTISRACIGCCFVGVGYFMQQNVDEFVLKIRKQGLIIIGVLLFAINILLSMFQNVINLRIALVGNLLLYLLTGIIGSISVLFILRACGSFSWLNWLGRNSLIIMATHEPYYVMAFIVNMMLILAQTYSIHSYMIVITSFVITMLIEILIVVLIQKYLPFMLRYPKRKDVVNEKE